MKRGEIWTAAGGSDYLGKSRPVLIVQSDHFQDTLSVTVCPFTGDPRDAPLLRVPIEPDTTNGLEALSRVMIDKITTVPKSKLGGRIGQLADAQMTAIGRTLAVFLGLAG